MTRRSRPPQDEAPPPIADGGAPEAVPEPMAETREEPPVEIHKPHAAKSWREFGIEIGTIVLGILIALGLEQSVDALHKRNEIGEATESIRAEMVESLQLVHNRSLSEKCIAARFDQLQHVLSDAKTGKWLAGPAWVGRPPRWLMPVDRWDFIASSGRLALLPAKDQEDFAELHRRVIEINSDLLIEQTDWAQLRVLEVDPRITLQEEAMISAALQDARYRDFRIGYSIGRADDVAKRFGIEAPPSDYGGVRSLCVPFPTAPAEAKKIIYSKQPSTAEMIQRASLLSTNQP